MQTHFPDFPTLTTERLLLRELTEADAPEIFVQRSDERILRHISIPKAESLADALAFIQKMKANFQQGEGLYWAICPKGESKLIGTICLWNFQPEKLMAEVGYSLHPDHWGRGYASEALAAVAGFGFTNVGAAIIEAYSDTANQPSIHLLEKNGFVRTGVEAPHAIYALCRPPLGTVLLETERLRLREITPEHAPFLLELLNTPDWLANIGDRGVRNLDDARKYIIYRMFSAYHKTGFGAYVMERKSDNAAVGNCGLVKRDFLDDVDIGYAMLPQFYGHGYAHEAASAILTFAKEKLKLPRLVAMTIESNKPSIKLVEKLGLRFERRFFTPGDDEELLLFGIAFESEAKNKT